MAHTYQDYGFQAWPHHYPVIYHSAPYNAISPQDEHWTPMELLPNLPNNKDHYFYNHQTTLMPGQIFMTHSAPDRTSTHDDGRAARYHSPTGSHHSSILTESSASSESFHSPDYPMSASLSPPFYGPSNHVGVHDGTLANHAIWSAENHQTPATLHDQPNIASFHSQNILLLGGLHAEHQDEEVNLDINFVDVDRLSESPKMRHPEEMRLAEDNSEMETIATASPLNLPGSALQHEHHSPSEEEMEDDDDESAPLDNDSDPDYDNRPSRRRAARTSPKGKNNRRSSSGTIVASRSRVHKRTSSSSTTTSTTSVSRGQAHRTSKVTKPRGKGPTFASKPPSVSKFNRTYPCTFHRYGCDKEFPNKNEWKRHVTCQHLQLGYYRCDLPGCNPDFKSSTRHPERHSRVHGTKMRSAMKEENSDSETVIVSYNDFNRKDLFTQHCRRMHGPLRDSTLRTKPLIKKNGEARAAEEDEIAFENQLEEIRARCWHVRRHPPSRSACGFCHKIFDREYYESGSNSTCSGHNGECGPEEKAWEDRMEHIGRHFEKDGFHKDNEEVDEDLVEWGLRTGVLRTLKDGRTWLVTATDPVPEEAGSHRSFTSGETSESAIVEDQERFKIKPRRQSGRTIEHRRVSFKEEEMRHVH